MAGKKKAVGAGYAHGSGIINAAGAAYCPPDDRAHQRAVLLDHLRQRGSISTIEARRQYSIMSPASRVFELRGMGHGIITRRDPVQKCARYHLAADSGGGGDAID